MPIWADWAAAVRSAWRMSGRRVSNWAGMPMATVGGAVGIAAVAQAFHQVLRRDAQEHAEAVVGLPHVGFQGRDLRLDLLHGCRLIRGPCSVTRPALKRFIDDLQDVPLQLALLFRTAICFWSVRIST